MNKWKSIEVASTLLVLGRLAEENSRTQEIAETGEVISETWDLDKAHQEHLDEFNSNPIPKNLADVYWLWAARMVANGAPEGRIISTLARAITNEPYDMRVDISVMPTIGHDWKDDDGHQTGLEFRACQLIERLIETGSLLNPDKK